MNHAGGLQKHCELALPDWLGPFLADWRHPLDTDERRMRLAVALAGENVSRRTGGPFAALVVEDRGGRLLGAGVNRVTALGLSLAHAEILALSFAQCAIADWNLGSQGPVQLVTSCEPCAMCFGAVPWSGVSSLLWGARKEDAEAAGFDEGDKPANWIETLEARGIKATGDVLRAEAAAVLTRYAGAEIGDAPGGVLTRYAGGDGAIYHPNI